MSDLEKIEENSTNCPLCGRPLWLPAFPEDAERRYCESCNRVFEVKKSG